MPNKKPKKVVKNGKIVWSNYNQYLTSHYTGEIDDTRLKIKSRPVKEDN